MCSFLKNAKKNWITPPYNPRVKSPTSERGLLARRFNQFNAPYILLNSYFNFSSCLRCGGGGQVGGGWKMISRNSVKPSENYLYV